MPAPDPFPATQRTWILHRLEDGGGNMIRDHLMSVYGAPLQQLARERLRLDSESAMDLVHGFFASRLSRQDYLQKWNERQMPLRRWLWKGLSFYAQERRREDRRLRTMPELPDVEDPRQPDPATVVDRVFAAALVREAVRRARKACERDGFALHWEVFARRHLGGERLADLAREFELSPDRALVMLRAPRRRFQESVTDLLIADGVRRADVPRALRQLQDLVP